MLCCASHISTGLSQLAQHRDTAARGTQAGSRFWLCPEAAPQTSGTGNSRTWWALHMKLNCISGGAMVGTARASAIPSAEVSDEVRCPWDTKPERLPTGTAPSFPSLTSPQGFSPLGGVSQLSWLFPSVFRWVTEVSPSSDLKRHRPHLPSQTKVKQCCSQGPSGGPSEAI